MKLSPYAMKINHERTATKKLHRKINQNMLGFFPLEMYMCSHQKFKRQKQNKYHFLWCIGKMWCIQKFAFPQQDQKHNLHMEEWAWLHKKGKRP